MLSWLILLSALPAFGHAFTPATIKTTDVEMFPNSPAKLQSQGAGAVGSRLADRGLSARLSLNIGREAGTLMPKKWATSGARLLLRDIDVSFSKESPRTRTLLPGLNGPRPGYSSGSRALRIGGSGGATLMDTRGASHIPLHDGAWEIVMRPNALAGQLVLSLDAPEGAERRDADETDPRVPTAAQVYLTLPVWEDAHLKQLQEKLARARAKAGEAVKRKNDALETFSSSPNLILKALSFRRACEARDDEDMASVSAYEAMIPGPDGTIIVESGDDDERPTALQIGALGSVWLKREREQHVLLGTCSMSHAPEAMMATVVVDTATTAPVECDEARVLRAQAAALMAEAATLEDA